MNQQTIVPKESKSPVPKTVYLWLKFIGGLWSLNCSSQGFRLSSDGFSLGSPCPNAEIATLMLDNARTFFETLGLAVKIQIREEQP